MSDLQKEIDLLKARLDELEGRNKGGVAEPVKWQPKGGNWRVDSEGQVVEEDTSCGSKGFGTERQTKKQAQRASIEMRRFNRLLALRDELCGDDVDDLEENKETYFVFYSKQSNMWKKDYILNLKFETPLFTSRESAQKACDMLNSGEVEL